MAEKTYFRTDRFEKFSEEDVYENGCIPETGASFFVDVQLKGDTIEELVENIKNYFGVSDSNIEKNACDEDGRIDVALYETENGYTANKSSIEEWKNGELKLWYAVYTTFVVKVTEEKVTL